jgi:hypothetical protein
MPVFGVSGFRLDRARQRAIRYRVVVGTVRDASGGVVPGATVSLTSNATGITAVKVTGADGNFEFFTVRPGVYLVTAEKEGFSIALADNRSGDRCAPACASTCRWRSVS